MEDFSGQIEDDDLVYLDCYLDSLYNESPNFNSVTSTWSPLSEELGYSSEPYLEIAPSLLDIQSSSDIDATEIDKQPTRKNKGIPSERFVTYESFPPVKKKPIPCEFCGIKLATKESCKRHILSKHIKEKRHMCDTCGKTFVFKFSLKTHSAIHDATPKHVCVCGASFKLRTSYMSHIRRIHQAAPETKFSCELCFKSFRDRHTLRLHMVSVHKPKTIPCIEKTCDKVFSSISLMRCHYRYHLNQKFTCDKCGQSFSTESYMQKHLLSHSGIRPYTCVDCSKTYLSASHLNQHLRICHSTDRLHQCSFCGKRFKTKDLLKYHESNHRGEKPYKCKVCGYATAYKNTYYVHRKKHLADAASSSAEKQSMTKSANNDAIVKKNKNVTNKTRNRKTQPARKPKVLSEKDNQSVFQVVRQDQFSNPCNNSIDAVSSSPSFSSSSLPFSLPSPSVSSSTKQVNVDFIIFPTNVINCSPQQITEPVLTNSVQLLKCGEPEMNLITDNISFDEHCDKDQAYVPSKEQLVNQTTLETEKTDCSVILSNNGRCSISECDCTDDSLLLIKIGDNSYAGVCTNHSISSEAEISELNLNSVENLTLTTVDSKCLSTDVIDTDNSLGLSSSFNNENILPSQSASQDSQSIFNISSPDKGASPLTLSSIDQSSTSALVECSQPNITDALLLPLPPPEGLKSVVGEVDQTETIVHSAEIDSGMPSLSSHIDDSFHLAQLEVVCQICDEQFLCMDSFITHMECIHK